MKRRDFIRTGVGASLLSLLPRSGVFAEGPSSTTRPNVLFLFSDQHNATMTSYAGHPVVRTPALDGLAAAGVRFDRAYCQDGVCCPSRSSLITGQYPRTLGLYDNAAFRGKIWEASALPKFTSMQSAFHQAGYYTFTAGKRHVLPTADRDWDYSAGHLTQGQWPPEWNVNNYWAWLDQQGLKPTMLKDWGCEFGPNNTSFALGISALPPEATMEAFTAQKTLEFLKSPQAKKQPFFAWSTFYRPHQPYTPQKKYVDAIDFASIPLPASLHEDPANLPPYLAHIRGNTKKDWDCGVATDDLYRTYIGYYIALVHEIDDHIGSILAMLEQQGLAENTIVVYCSDHGDFVGNHGLPEKQSNGHNFYEDTLRVPLIVRWPGTIPKAARSDLVELVDLYPTLLDLAGIAAPATNPLAGRSLADALRHGTAVGRNYVVSENWSQASVITDDFKYGQWIKPVHAPKDDYRTASNRLVQRSVDPGEVKNLIADPAFATKKDELAGYLTEWVGKIDDSGRKEFFAANGQEYSAV